MSELRVIRRTASLCSTWSLVPRPSTIPARTVSLAWLNRLAHLNGHGKGVVYVRLANGVNAVAHSCYDYRMPGKKDDVSFAVTRLDMERGVAVGIITRIIRQNL